MNEANNKTKIYPKNEAYHLSLIKGNKTKVIRIVIFPWHIMTILEFSCPRREKENYEFHNSGLWKTFLFHVFFFDVVFQFLFQKLQHFFLLFLFSTWKCLQIDFYASRNKCRKRMRKREREWERERENQKLSLDSEFCSVLRVSHFHNFFHFHSSTYFSLKLFSFSSSSCACFCTKFFMCHENRIFLYETVFFFTLPKQRKQKQQQKSFVLEFDTETGRETRSKVFFSFFG